jgi:hypothetical protein
MDRWSYFPHHVEHRSNAPLGRSGKGGKHGNITKNLSNSNST